MAAALRRIMIALSTPEPLRTKIIAAKAAANRFPIVQLVTLDLSARDDRM
jgi:hypothetical protein